MCGVRLDSGEWGSSVFGPPKPYAPPVERAASLGTITVPLYAHIGEKQIHVGDIVLPLTLIPT